MIVITKINTHKLGFQKHDTLFSKPSRITFRPQDMLKTSKIYSHTSIMLRENSTLNQEGPKDVFIKAIPQAL